MSKRKIGSAGENGHHFDPVCTPFFSSGKARRLKQAKEEAQDEIEKYRQEKDRQFKEFEAKVINR